MVKDEFTAECLELWTKAIASAAGGNPPRTSVWTGLESIEGALEPFMAPSKNHAHLPTGGGLDVLSVARSIESGCLEFIAGERSVWILKPKLLTLEYITRSPIDSFLLLELDALPATTIYDPPHTDREDLLEVEPGEYADRSVWEQGFLGHDEDGYEISIPNTSRLAMRWLEGKILIVSKRSIWNGVPGNYDGRHNSMTSAEIRSFIEDSFVVTAYS